MAVSELGFICAETLFPPITGLVFLTFTLRGLDLCATEHFVEYYVQRVKIAFGNFPSIELTVDAFLAKQEFFVMVKL